nr:hypothetical protein [Tanacetum cinerariifolium]
MAYHDKYKKVLNEIWKDKVGVYGKIVKDENETIKKIKGEALKEKDDPGEFIFPIRLKGKVNKNALANTGSDINTMPYQIYETLGREEMKKTMGRNDDEAKSSRSKCSRQFEIIEEVLGVYQAVKLDEEGFNVYFEGGLRSDEHFNAQEYWLSISREDNLGLSRSHTSTIKSLILRVIHKMITYGLCQRTTGYDKIQKNDLWLLSKFDARHQNGYVNVAWLIARDLDTTTLRDLIDSEGRLIPKDPQPCVPIVGVLRPLRASIQDLYDRMGRMEIC